MWCFKQINGESELDMPIQASALGCLSRFFGENMALWCLQEQGVP
jgi:hypothetical protein